MKKLWSNPRGIELSNVGNAYWFGREEKYMLDKTELKALYDAIGDDLGLGWKKYIPGESEPEKSGWYYTTIENENGMGLAYGLWTPETGFTDSGGWEIQDVVHAFRLPFELYQPEDSHDIV
jgi:hypothetical protein